MKKKILLVLIMFYTVVVFGQYNDYDRGFQSGYKEGYCYNDFGCIAPIPPITPIPLIGESSDNYRDGYNRGFKMGLEDKQSKKSNKGGYNSNQGYVPQNQNSFPTLDYSLLIKAMEMKQAYYEKNEQMKKEKAVALMNQVKSYYNSLTSFPLNIPNGWHKVIATNNYDICAERKVYVESGKVTKYFIEDWIDRKVSFSSVINNAKAMVQLVMDDGTKADMVDVYFLEYINDPNSYTSPPTGSGKVSFWTNWKRSGDMELYLDNMYIGKFTSYFDNGTPNCGQKGTLTVTYKPGTYSFKAISTGGWSTKTWEGTVTIYSGDCTLQGLTK